MDEKLSGAGGAPIRSEEDLKNFMKHQEEVISFDEMLFRNKRYG